MADEELAAEIGEIARKRREKRRRGFKIVGGLAALFLAGYAINAIPVSTTKRTIGFVADMIEMVRPNEPTLDVSFSLTCRSLESWEGGDILFPWNTAVKDYLHDPVTGQPHGVGDASSRTSPKIVGEGNVKNYDTNVRIAFNHGKPDGQSAWEVGGLRVVEATSEAIVLRGSVEGHDKAEGFFDRRTGHGDIKYYDYFRYDGATKTFTQTYTGSGDVLRITKQFIYECEPSKPAKF